MSRKKAGMSANAKWGIAFLIEIVVMFFMVVGYIFFYANRKLDNINRPENWDDSKENLDINEDANEAQEGFRTIALFGIDSRSTTSMAEGNRSDSIIIASINNDTKEVKLASVYRDSLLQVDYEGGITTKITHAYAYGGPKAAIETLNKNLDLQITEYATVNFASLTKVIDDLGGLDLEITEGEMNQINKYKKDVDLVTGKSTPNVTQYGLVHLDGTQATTYARIRKLAGDDFKRASRQRIVLQAIMEKAKKADFGTLTSICNSVIDDISTSLSITEILSLAKDVASYNIASTTGFPFELTTEHLAGSGDTVIPADLATNVVELHKYMFDDETYTLSSTVQTISDAIVYKTGITSESAKINTSDYNETAGATGTDGIKKSTDTQQSVTN